MKSNHELAPLETLKKPEIRKAGAVAEAEDHECFILPLGLEKDSANKIRAKIGVSPKRWDEAIHHQFSLFQKHASEGVSEKSTAPVTVTLSLSSGGSIRLLFIDKKISTHRLQTSMRKAFEGAANSTHAKTWFSTALLPNTLQENTLFQWAALVQAARWKSPVFGQKASQKTKASDPHPIRVMTSLNPAAALKALERGWILGQANNWVRTLALLPTNELTPPLYTARIKKLAAAHPGIRYEFWNCSKLREKGCGAFLAVARSEKDSAAGIVRLSYSPKAKSKNTKKLALVGKGICYDTGGYNVKVAGGMYGMKNDMTGSALAMSLCLALAHLKADFEIEVYLAIAENLISPTSYKPDEVIIACDGTSIEVMDTDAEGRIVLSDTLALARRSKPDLMIDYATLTGSAMRALGTARSAIFSNREKLARQAVESGDASGERVWNFPIGDEYREGIESDVADILQCSPTKFADHIYAATFLSHFAGEETPWIHVDLSCNENKGGLGLYSSTTTGFGIFWTAELLNRAI